jgi:hypothetical protein
MTNIPGTVSVGFNYAVYAMKIKTLARVDHFRIAERPSLSGLPPGGNVVHGDWQFTNQTRK